ncbi:tight adherence protein B [Frankia sp. EI5c]|uniref:secretion system protein n=1 Tax=Frankia sp. EI5c TaxID=683316 RepID=UPI0007C2C2A7|nr:secretion system protein [Frankia sp. EI5c]OAA27056.1 tight adherence protein B [Frankia sp. EI5c]
MTTRLIRWIGGTGAVVAATALAGPLAGITVILLFSGRRALHRWVLRRYETELRVSAEDVLAGLATELDAGATPDEALRTALASVSALPAHPGVRAGPAGRVAWPLDLPRLRDQLAGSGDSARLLARCDAAALRQLATAFRVCRLTGVRLAPVAAMLADAARSDAARADELASALAGPRSSGRLVASLPLLGVALGALLGAAPAQVLVTPPLGTACLTAGVLLDLAGLRWLRRIADGVQARVPPVCAGPVEPGRSTWRPRPGQPGSRRGGATSAEYRRRLLADLPLALDLVSACLRSGATTPQALEVVGIATGGPAGVELRATGRALRHGTPAQEACLRMLAAVGESRARSPSRDGHHLGDRRHRGAGTGLRRVLGLGAFPRRASARQREGRMVLAAAAAIGRTESSGARLATTLTRISARARQEAHAATITAARRAGVLAVAPLGLCFLPAFLLLGVVPVVIGSAPDLGPALSPGL